MFYLNAFFSSNFDAFALRFHPSIPLDIDHLDSQQNYGLQVCDIFCYGIASKYERKKFDWLRIFEEKIKLDEIYLT